jgi:hypothetical protein
LSEGCEPLISRQDVPLLCYRVGCVASRSKLPRERFSPLARNGHGAMSGLSPLCAQERTRSLSKRTAYRVARRLNDAARAVAPSG